MHKPKLDPPAPPLFNVTSTTMEIREITISHLPRTGKI